MAAKAKRKQKRRGSGGSAGTKPKAPKQGNQKPDLEKEAAADVKKASFSAAHEAELERKKATTTGPDGKPLKRRDRLALKQQQRKERAPEPHKLDVRYGVVRPKPIWSPFPLTELATVLGVGLVVAGFVQGPDDAPALIGGGSIILGVAIGEMCVREHFAGFKSHTLLLGFLPVVVLHSVIVFGLKVDFYGPIALFVDVTICGILMLLLQAKYRTVEREAQKRARDSKKRRRR